MNKKIFIANWKSHKTASQSVEFISLLSPFLEKIDLLQKEIIICPPFTALPACALYIAEHNLPIKLGAQNVSRFPEGAYTGEIAASQIKEFAQYVLIGHSERRKYQLEAQNDFADKIQQARSHGLGVIFCMQNEDDYLSDDIDYVTYEPPSAISTFGVGKAENAVHVAEILARLRKRTAAPLLYGGSVKEDNIQSYFSAENLSGFLIGSASLEADSFARLLSSC